MSYLLLGIAVAFAIFFWRRYSQQRRAIRLLAESLRGRRRIIAPAAPIRNAGSHWAALVEELNDVIQEIGRLDRVSSGQLKQIETTLGALQEGVIIVDRDNYILLINKALRSIVPTMTAEVGQRVEVGLRSADFLEFVLEAKTEGGAGRKEIFLDMGGSEIWIEATAARLTEAPEGNGPWFLFILHDITKLKRLEAARKQFVADASHELKTPVAIIKGYAETLESDFQTMTADDRERFLTTIHRHAERLSLLVNDLLSLSRLENEMGSFEWQRQDLVFWLRQAVEDYQSNMPRKDLMVTFDSRLAATGVVRFDQLKLRQVLDNLIDNAAKYSPENGAIAIGAERRASEIRFWVRDEGPGAPASDLGRIFERFYRVDKGRARGTGGTGLGLSIVKHIVEAHGGRVWAENGEAGGLKVVVVLPLLEEVAEQQRSEAIGGEAPAG